MTVQVYSWVLQEEPAPSLLPRVEAGAGATAPLPQEGEEALGMLPSEMDRMPCISVSRMTQVFLYPFFPSTTALTRAGREPSHQ